MPAERGLAGWLADAVAQFGDRPAVGQSVRLGGATSSYRQLWDATQRGAHRLHRLGLAPGERVLLFAEATPEWPAAFFSILAAGHVVVPVTADTPEGALRAVASYAAVAAVVISNGTEVAAAALEDARALRIDELLAPMLSSAEPRTAFPRLAMLAFTSGSTRQPLAVELTHANLLADLRALLQARRAAPGDIFLSMLPPTHLFELMGGLLGPLACGAKVVYPGRPLPNRLIESLREDRITHACCVPALLQALYEEVLDELAGCGLIEPAQRAQTLEETSRRLFRELSASSAQRLIAGVRERIGESLRTLVLGGAALDPVWIPILDALSIRAEIGYGLTEAAPIVSLGLASECPPGSVGRPLPGVEVVVDAHGEILVRGENVTPGYYRAPEATRDALVDGWLRTGDRGRLDGEGFLFVTGRLKEAMVTAAGETLYPEEVEPYYASPLFAEWCVAGRPGPQGNDLPTLFVVPARPYDSDRSALAEAFQALRSTAPARFRLDKLVCLDQPLPRTALGKPRRRAVVEMWLGNAEQDAGKHP